MDWQVMMVLGAYHGINPGMGWLFAVALGCKRSGNDRIGILCRGIGKLCLLAVALRQ